MKCVGLLGKIVLALTFGLGLLLATAEDRELAFLDVYHPATLLRLVTSRVRAVQAYVRDLRASHSVAGADVRDHIRRESAALSPVE